MCRNSLAAHMAKVARRWRTRRETRDENQWARRPRRSYCRKLRESLSSPQGWKSTTDRLASSAAISKATGAQHTLHPGAPRRFVGAFGTESRRVSCSMRAVYSLISRCILSASSAQPHINLPGFVALKVYVPYSVSAVTFGGTSAYVPVRTCLRNFIGLAALPFQPEKHLAPFHVTTPSGFICPAARRRSLVGARPTLASLFPIRAVTSSSFRGHQGAFREPS